MGLNSCINQKQYFTLVEHFNIGFVYSPDTFSLYFLFGTMSFPL